MECGSENIKINHTGRLLYIQGQHTRRKENFKYLDCRWFLEQISESGNNIIMQEDMEYLANDQKIPIDKLQNSTVLVTGATGLLGSQIVRYLLCLNRVKKYDIKVIALATK